MSGEYREDIAVSAVSHRALSDSRRIGTHRPESIMVSLGMFYDLTKSAYITIGR
jgi:hypothetical protein